VATKTGNRTALGTFLLVGLVWSVGLPSACSKASPTSPDPLPICEEQGSPPLRSTWADTPCPTPEEIAIIRQEINITFNNLPPSPTVCRGEGLPDGLSWYEERLYAQLLMFRTVQIDAPLPWTNLPLWDWLRHAIAGIVVEIREGSACCSPAKVIHIGQQPRALSSEFNWRRTPDTLLQTVIMHEAWHAETGRGHTCDRTKDSTISEMAAFGVQYTTMTLIAEHSNASSELREWARYSAIGLRSSPSAFCRECSNANTGSLSSFARTSFGLHSPISKSSCGPES
jgi:hypothetical protein